MLGYHRKEYGICMIQLINGDDCGVYSEIIVTCDDCKATYRASGDVEADVFVDQLERSGWAMYVVASPLWRERCPRCNARPQPPSA